LGPFAGASSVCTCVVACTCSPDSLADLRVGVGFFRGGTATGSTEDLLGRPRFGCVCNDVLCSSSGAEGASTGTAGMVFVVGFFGFALENVNPSASSSYAVKAH